MTQVFLEKALEVSASRVVLENKLISSSASGLDLVTDHANRCIPGDD